MGGSSQAGITAPPEPQSSDFLSSHNATDSSHSGHTPAHKNLPMAAAQIQDTLKRQHDKPEEIDTSPYTASVLGVIIAICFLLGLLGVSISQARERRREKKTRSSSAVNVGRLQLGRRGSAYGEERTTAGSVVSFASSDMLPGLSSKPLNFDVERLGSSNLEPQLFAATIKEELEKEKQRRSSVVAGMSVSSVSAGTYVRPAGFDVDKLGKGRPREPEEPKVYVATLTEELKVPASPLSFGSSASFNKSCSEQLQLESDNVRPTSGKFTMRAI